MLTASAAFCNKFVSAWRSIRRSQGTTGPRSGISVIHSMPGLAVFCNIRASRAIRPMSSGLITGCGIREGREFIHHATDIADVADDGIGALSERIRIGLDFLGEAALQALRRK